MKHNLISLANLIYLLVLFVLLLVQQSNNTLSSQCVDILHHFYSCTNKNNEISLDTKKCVPNYVYDHMNDAISDSFFQNTFKNVTSFQSAMRLVQANYNYLKACSTSNDPRCRCVLNHGDASNYSFFFTSPTFFPQMVALLDKLHSRTKFDYSEAVEEGLFVEKELPALDQFCYKYEFTLGKVYIYEEAHECFDEMPENIVSDCLFSYLTPNLYEQNFTTYNKSSIVQYVRCLVSTILTCEIDIERVITFSLLTPFPQIIDGTNLTTYLDWIIGTSKNVTPLVTTASAVVHSMGIIRESSEEEAEECDFSKNFECLNSPQLKINCSGSRLINGESKVTALSFAFISSNTNGRGQQQTVNFAFSSRAKFPCNFGSIYKNQTILWSPTNGRNKWLEIADASDDEFPQHVHITDYVTNASINIIYLKSYGTFAVVLTSTSTFFQSKNTNGMLIKGCPKSPRG